MFSARRRGVLGLALAVVAATAVGAGAGPAAAVPGDETVVADAPTTTFGHSTVVSAKVTNADAGAVLRWCVVPSGQSDCGSDGSVPLAEGDSTVWTKPLSTSLLVPGTNKVKVYYDGDANGVPDVVDWTTVTVQREAPEITVSLTNKVVAAKDVTRKKIGAYAWVGAVGVNESAMAGKMALVVDGKRVTPWTPLKMIAIPGSTNKKPAMSVTIPPSAIKKRGNHIVQFHYQASGASAVAVGTGIYTSLKRTFQTQ